MAHSAIHIASVVYDAAQRRFQAAVEMFAPGLPVPLRVGVTLSAPQGTEFAHLARGFVVQAQRQVLREGRLTVGG